jgi:hypothetical protein
MLKHPGTHRLWQPWSKETWAQLSWQRLCNHPHDAGFSRKQNERVVGLKKLPVRFQKKAQEARPCVVGFGLLVSRPEWAMHEAVTVKMKMQWRLQMSGTLNNCGGVPQALNKANPRERPIYAAPARP